MPKVRVHNLAMSIDGFAAGPNQSVDNPLGERGEELHEWVFKTPTGRRMMGEADATGDEGVDDTFLAAGDVNVGATIMGRNMFGPIRGGWGDDEWRGWWGPKPPYRHPVFVLTNHAHDPIPMEGGTTFNFVTDGIESALAQAMAAAGGKDVRIGGGASTIQQYLRAGLIDDLHVAVIPIVLGAGEPLFGNLADGLAGYECVELVSSPSVAHVRFAPV